MDLDTSARKFKYSLLNKTICAVLCFVTAMSACFFTAGAVSTVINNSENSAQYNDYTDTEYITNQLTHALYYPVRSVLSKPDELKKALEDKQKSVCDNVYSQVKSIYDGNKDYDVARATFDISSADVPFADDEYTFDYYTQDTDVSDSKNENDIYNDIVKKYGEFVSETCQTYTDESAVYGGEPSWIEYIIVHKDHEFSTNTQLSKDDILSSDTYIKIENGTITGKGIAQNTLNKILNSTITDFDSKSYSLYAKIDSDSNNNFTAYRDFWYFAKEINNNIYLVAAAAVISWVISFACGFYFMQISGRKKEGANADLWFIDYIPLEFQIILTSALGFGVYYVFNIIPEAIWYNFTLFAICLMFVCCAYWMLLFLLSSSVARYIHSGKKFYNHIFVCRVIIYLKKVFNKAFGFLKYKPKTFGKKVITLCVLFFIFNVIFVFSAAIAFAASFGGSGDALGTAVGIVFVVLLVYIDTLAIIKAAKYFKNLDGLIASSAQHKSFDGNTEKLPDSLRVLSESINYTNTQLEEAIAKAVKDERLRAELITNVSHDLKTPLTSIINYVDLLDKCGINDEKARGYICVLNEKSARLKRLIDDLIEASKVTSGNISVNIMPLNLSELCLQSTVEVQKDFEAAGLELIVKQGDKPVNVMADGAKTFRVIQNLLSNARKYSAPASRVYVDVYEEGQNGVFEIKNISAQPLDITPDELTERFVRGDKSRNMEGNGLGLSIAKELCKVQNGSLDISIDGDLFKAKVSLKLSDKQQ